MAYTGIEQILQQEQAEESSGGLPPSRTSGFSWRTILAVVLVLGAVGAAIAFGLPLLFR